MRAIDLYAGIGGWSLGLRLAGIEVAASYEWWQPAIDTHNGNLDGASEAVDIRALSLEDLPQEIDLVVGSPPCTEFSYANRGGGGDISEGLKDVVKFLEIVDYLRPKYWALENVPRVADVLRRGLAETNHPLWRFRHLKPQIEVIDFSDYGAPQSRRRCIAGNFPLALMRAYTSAIPRKTLGDVVRAYHAKGKIVDPVWGCSLDARKVTERETEPPLNDEELRMNREAKTYHPVYNNMTFPDDLDEPGRTVTATCTRVSRESIVIEDAENSGRFRRLTIRERASLQGFPITYQFFARSFPEKAKMVGNAIPPTFSYVLAQACVATPVAEFRNFQAAGKLLRVPDHRSKVTLPTMAGGTYPEGRSFRAAIPGLRFKSGMRFELSNDRGGEAGWAVKFFYGPSTDIRQIDLSGALLGDIMAFPHVQRTRLALGTAFLRAERRLNSSGPETLQRVWSHRAIGLGPFEVTDLLGALAEQVREEMAKSSMDQTHALIGYVLEAAARGGQRDEIPGAKKLAENAAAILSGILVGSWFNTLAWHHGQQAVA